MKICIATTSFPRWADDHRAPYILEAARAIMRLGHSVRVVTLHYPGSKINETLDGVEVIRVRYLPDKWEILQKEDGGLPVMWRKYPFARPAILPLVFFFARSIAQNSKDCDLIHANWTLAGICAWLGQTFHKKPYIVTVHGSDIFQGSQIPMVRLLTKRSLEASSGVVCVSEALAKAVAMIYQNRTRTCVIPNGIDTSKFPMSNEVRQPFILFVGAMTENKGVNFLLEAYSKVLRDVPEVRLILAGDGPQRAAFGDLAMSLGLSKKVDFVGSLPQSTIGQLMRQTRLLLLPSISEGLPVVLIEALASGTPCIASFVGGIPEIITSDVGRVVPPADSRALCNAMLELLCLGENEYQYMSQRARERATQLFDWRVVAPQIVDVYRQAI